MEFNCNLCDEKCPTMTKLRQHTLLCISKPDKENDDQQVEEADDNKDESIPEQLIKAEESLTSEDDNNLVEEKSVLSTDITDEDFKDFPNDVQIKRFFEPARCELCNKMFANEINLKNHIALIHKKVSEDGNGSFVCTFCEKVLANSKSLGVHIKSIHSEQKTVQCEFCAKEIKYSYINKHVADMHSHSNHKIQCTKCGKVLSNKTNLRVHTERVHTEHYTVNCEHCGKTIKSTTIKWHVREMHEKDNRLAQCQQCGKQLSNRTNLKLHMNTVHTSAPTVVCEYCTKFIKSTNIKSHVKEMHDNYVDTPCPVCEKIFPRRKAMTDHMRNIHSNTSKEPVVVCEYCSKSIKSTNIKSHVKEMHDNYVDTPCPECGRIFPRRKAMTDHLRNIHRNTKKSVVSIAE